MSSDFRQNLRSELSYQNITVKELSYKTGIPKATLNCYVGARATMPTADVAVKIASALGVSVEFLVTGERKTAETETFSTSKSPLKDIIRDLSRINADLLPYVRGIVASIVTTQEGVT